jgi:DNA polymerase epsilon subunit 1
LKREDDGTAAQERFEEIKVYEEIDERLGFWRFESGKAQGEEKEGWLVNMHQVREVLVYLVAGLGG